MKILVKTNTFYSGSNNNNYNFFTIKEILYTILQKKDYIIKDLNLKITVQEVKKVVLKKRHNLIGHSRSILDNNLGKSSDKRI